MPAQRLLVPRYSATLISMIRALLVLPPLFFSVAFCAAADTDAPATNPSPPTNHASTIELREQLRTTCLNGRRSICGKILRIFPDGLLVESGYTNLLREPLTRSWLVPGSVVASRAQNLVESKEPGALCVGTIFLTNLPRGKPQQYDYVILAGYPTGEFSYNSVGSVRRTVRRFSANLDRAVQANLAAASESNALRPPR
jgi:hypothetical protein